MVRLREGRETDQCRVGVRAPDVPSRVLRVGNLWQALQARALRRCVHQLLEM